MKLSNSDFKKLVQKGKSPTGAFLRKDIATVPAVDSGNRTLRFVVSTRAVDRDGDTIDPNGWDLDAYRLNPQVLFGHDQGSLPIGKAISIDVVNDQLVMIVEFVPESVPVAGPIAEAVYQLCKTGFLSATSVGYVPIDFALSDDPSRSNGRSYPGMDHKRQALLEVSIVTVPSNYEALIDPASIPSEDVISDTAVIAPTTIIASHATECAKSKRQRALKIASLN